MRWFKEQWKSNTNFRHAITVLLVIGLSAAGVPPSVGNAVGAIVATVEA